MNEYQLLKLTERYESTGIIHDALIPYFDQDGRWFGDKDGWRRSVWAMLEIKMQNAFLPPFRRTRRCRAGTILRTSYHFNKKLPVSVTYCEVEGSFIVSRDTIIHAAQLRRVGGHFLTRSTKEVCLPNLTSVGGHFSVCRSLYLKAPRLQHVGGNVLVTGILLPRLETVGGRYGIRWAFNFLAPKLVHVGGTLVTHKATAIEAPALETVGGNLMSEFLARRIHAPKLQSVGGDFWAGSAVELHVPELRSVGGNLNTQRAKGFYHPKIHVGGEWITCPGAVEEWQLQQAAREAIRSDCDIEI